MAHNFNFRHFSIDNFFTCFTFYITHFPWSRKNKKIKTELNNNNKKEKKKKSYFFQIIKKGTDKKANGVISYSFKQYFTCINMCFLELYKQFWSMKKVSLNVTKTHQHQNFWIHLFFSIEAPLFSQGRSQQLL